MREQVYCTAATALFLLRPEAPAPATLADVYCAFFDHASAGWGGDGGEGGRGGAGPEETRLLLQLLMAARQPPSVAALELLGVRQTLPCLPGWGVLFQARISADAEPTYAAQSGSEADTERRTHRADAKKQANAGDRFCGHAQIFAG